MSLFPAYAQTSNITQTDNEEISGEWLAEAQLLASDTDEEREACRPRAATSPPEHHQHFYVDRKLDVANLRVSTLYYPGRPQYEARLEAEARSQCPRTQRALHAALDRLPQHKWLAVRGAAWLGAEAAALADVLLERRLRLHALLEELAPLEPTPLHEPHSL